MSYLDRCKNWIDNDEPCLDQIDGVIETLGFKLKKISPDDVNRREEIKETIRFLNKRGKDLVDSKGEDNTGSDEYGDGGDIAKSDFGKFFDSSPLVDYEALDNVDQGEKVDLNGMMESGLIRKGYG